MYLGVKKTCSIQLTFKWLRKKALSLSDKFDCITFRDFCRAKDATKIKDNILRENICKYLQHIDTNN